MMTLHYPTSNKFTLFHSIDQSWMETCHQLTVFEVSHTYAHTMILVLLPYLQWQFSKKFGSQASSIIARWFKLVAQTHAKDAYWDPWEWFLKNFLRNHMLEQVGNDNDDYISTVKMAASQKKKVPKLEMKSFPSKAPKMTKKSPSQMQLLKIPLSSSWQSKVLSLQIENKQIW